MQNILPLQTDEYKKEFLVNLIESLSVGIYFLIFAVAQVSQFFQADFINLSVYGPIYIISAVGLFFHTGSLLLPGKINKHPYWLVFLISLNILLATGLIYFSNLNQSMFFFLYLLNIVVAAMFFQVRGTLLTAVSSSALYNLIMIMGPDIKAGTFLFLTALNNLSFFVVAALSGYLSEQMEILGVQLEQTGKKLSEYAQLASVVIDKVPMPLFAIDSQGVVVRTNDYAAHFLNETSLMGKKLSDYFPFSKEGETRWKRSEDLIQDIVIRRGTLDIEGVESGSILLVEDITHQRKLEYNLRQQEKMAAVGQLAAGIAHEIRNPLAGISGSVQMLSLSAQSDDDKKLFNIIIKETDRLNNLISEFLDYSRPLTAPIDIIDLGSLVQESLELVKFNNKLRSDVIVETEIIKPLKVRAHKDKLKQALLNIIINGYQAMMKTEKPKMVIKTKKNEGRIILEIQDFGSGIPEKVKTRMFEPFLTTKVGGTGLGLAVTHKILENHNCLIEVKSEEGLGTTFILSFVEVLTD